MKLKNYALLLMVLSCLKTTAQKQIENEKDFNNFLYEEVSKYNDTLNTIKQDGILFIKFMIKDDGLINNIAFSHKYYPPALLYVLTNVLGKAKIAVSNGWDKTATYVLPLSYDYRPDMTPPITAEKWYNNSPKINVDSMFKYMTYDFNGFFKVPEPQQSLWGMKCVLLPMAKILAPRVYY
ncbi:hypothetical protein [Ferruginibacter sp.]|nr:hypothetical protein [Ferruginibacter sp.]